MRKKINYTENLETLGEKIRPTYIDPSPEILETFPNPHPDMTYAVHFETKEFTSLCPVTGQPDLATLEINYHPDELCVESKSLKLYLGAYRMTPAFMEDTANQIVKDLASVLKPRMIWLRGEWIARGGIVTRVSVTGGARHEQAG